MIKKLIFKLKESFLSVIPITIIVLILHFTIVPIDKNILISFLIGTILLIFGMGLFTLGANMSTMTMGENIASYLTKSKNIILMIIVYFFIGVIITVVEPDLQVLAQQFTSISNISLILSVAIGVGIFLVIALLRILFQIKLCYLLIAFYGLIFILSIFTPLSFIPVAFDSGGVTTGPITVPFIIALGIGMSSVRYDKSSEDDSFGLVSLCSIGPIIATMIMGMFSKDNEYSFESSVNITNTGGFLNNIVYYLKEVAYAIIPIVILFIIFQLFFLKLKKYYAIKILVGIIYTYIGLILFLLGANIGFMPTGNYLGIQIASLPYNKILIPIGMVIGFFIVSAEPAVHILTKQVEKISGGAIPKVAIIISLSIGVAVSLGLSMVRIINGINLFYFIIPGYLLALILTLFVPSIFTSIAFDSGGVASGPMTATFILPFAIGACKIFGGNILTDAFGIVAMIAMMPLITVQILGLIYNLKIKKSECIDGTEDDIIDL